MEAWLGDDHGLTGEQLGELQHTTDDIAARWPDEDDRDEREAALTAAYRLMAGDDGVVEELGQALADARTAELRALAGLQQAALTLVQTGRDTESGFGRRAGVDRMTVRKWLGKRQA
jgi:hypothetical protein